MAYLLIREKNFKHISAHGNLHFSRFIVLTYIRLRLNRVNMILYTKCSLKREFELDRFVDRMQPCRYCNGRGC